MSRYQTRGRRWDELGDVRERFFAEAEQVLAHGVALGPPAVDRSDARRAMLWQGRALVATKLSLVLGDETPGDNFHAVAIQPHSVHGRPSASGDIE